MANIQLYNMIEKCIIPEAEANNVLFLCNALSCSSLAYNLDQCIERLKKKNTNLKIDVITILEERHIYWNSKENKDTFEYKLRQNSKVWKKFSPNMLLHQKDDYMKKGINLE